MIRTTSRLALLAAALFVASGCSTFQDNDVAVRVGDAELSRDDFADAVREQVRGGPEADAPADALPIDRADQTETGSIVTTFVVTELVIADLEQFGVEVEPYDAPGATTKQRLEGRYTLASQAWLALTADQLVDDGTVDHYDKGPLLTGVACTQHVLLDTQAEAEAARERILSGEEFGDVAADVSIEPSAVDTGGMLPCSPTTDFLNQYVPDFASAAVSLVPGDVSEPVRTEFGYHVIRVVPFDEIDLSTVPVEMLQSLRVRSLPSRFEVVVDPQLGTWDVNRGLIPLG